MMCAGWEVAVLIPARNEERLIARCLESVIRASELLPQTTKATIVLVSDCSTDRTAEIARRLIGVRGSVLQTRAGTGGTARALAARYAIEKSTVPLSNVWLTGSKSANSIQNVRFATIL